MSRERKKRNSFFLIQSYGNSMCGLVNLVKFTNPIENIWARSISFCISWMNSQERHKKCDRRPTIENEKKNKQKIKLQLP